jgi:Arm DNA-binding domain
MTPRSAQGELLASDEFVGIICAHTNSHLAEIPTMPLTDTAVRHVKRREKPQKLSDGGGLHLLVNPDGARYWRMAYRYQGRRRLLRWTSIYSIVPLAEARMARPEKVVRDPAIHHDLQRERHAGPTVHHQLRDH